MNFISIWMFVTSSVFAAAVLLAINVVPIMLIKDARDGRETGLWVVGGLLGLIIYSFEIAIVLQVLFGRV